jgi:hypothetical protein
MKPGGGWTFFVSADRYSSPKQAIQGDVRVSPSIWHSVTCTQSPSDLNSVRASAASSGVACAPVLGGHSDIYSGLVATSRTRIARVDMPCLCSGANRYMGSSCCVFRTCTKRRRGLAHLACSVGHHTHHPHGPSMTLQCLSCMRKRQEAALSSRASRTHRQVVQCRTGSTAHRCDLSRSDSRSNGHHQL